MVLKEVWVYFLDTDELEPRDKYSQHRYEDRLAKSSLFQSFHF